MFEPRQSSSVYGAVKKSREASECKAFCKERWQNTATRMYYIGLCEEEGAYEEALQALDESMLRTALLANCRFGRNIDSS